MESAPIKQLYSGQTLHKFEDFAAAFPETYREERNRRWLEGAWKRYRGKCSFAEDAYEEGGYLTETCTKILDAIYPRRDGNKADNKHYGWLWDIEDVCAEAARDGADRLYDRSAKQTFDESPIAIAAYLAAPSEFHTRKADTFFVRYAVSFIAHRIEHTLDEAKRMATTLRHFFVSSLIGLAILYGLLVYGMHNNWDILEKILAFVLGTWLVIVVLCVLFSLLPLLFTAFKREKLRDLVKRYWTIAFELSEQSFDPETIARHLQQLEAKLDDQHPSHIYTLLKRLADPKTQYSTT
jgi:hypothetical protein